jgi:predicted site-specific integrase-resolvase
MSSKYIKPEVLAETFDVTKRTLNRWADSGAMPARIRIAGTIRFETEAVESWMADGCPATDGNEQGSEQ